MSGKTIVPLIDLVFLTLGSVLAAMTQMQRVESIPVAVSRVGAGAAATPDGQFDVVALTGQGLTWNGQAVAEEQLPDKAAGKNVVLRAQRDLPTERTLGVLAGLTRAADKVSLEVRPHTPANRQDGRR